MKRGRVTTTEGASQDSGSGVSAGKRSRTASLSGPAAVQLKPAGEADEDGPRTYDIRELFGDAYKDRLLQARLSEAEIARSTLQVTGNARRYLLNDDEVVVRVDEAGIIRASHTKTNARNKAAVADGKEEAAELTDRIKALRAQLCDHPGDPEAQAELDHLLDERRGVRKDLLEDRLQAGWHGALAGINNAIGREDE